jgi:nucleoid DNA-binding protein
MAEKTKSKKSAGKAPAEAAKPLSKTAVYQELVTATGLERKQVVEVLDALEALIKKELGSKGAGAFALFDLVKLRRHHTPARTAGKKPNPFKPGEMIDVKASPAKTEMKVVKLKGLKDLA